MPASAVDLEKLIKWANSPAANSAKLLCIAAVFLLLLWFLVSFLADETAAGRGGSKQAPDAKRKKAP
jgi:hypothetical protein